MELHNQAGGNAISKLDVLNKETFLNKKIASIHYQLLSLVNEKIYLLAFFS